MKILVLHHADADGFGAAYAFNTTLKPTDEVTYTPVQYGQEPPDVSGYDFLYILDFSYKRSVMEELYAKMDGRMYCIDHHKTAQAELEGLPYCLFDMEKSGAGLTWAFCWPNDTHLPTILAYVQDRDLWKFDLPDSKAVNAYIATLEWDFGVWDQFDLATAKSAGTAILAFQQRQVEGRLKDVKMVSLVTIQDELWQRAELPHPYIFDTRCNDEDRVHPRGVDIPTVNASENISELGEAMCHAYPDAPFSMSYCDRADGSRSYSLRSRNGFDVSVVAKAFGGGGHKASAGFTLKAPDII